MVGLQRLFQLTKYVKCDSVTLAVGVIAESASIVAGVWTSGFASVQSLVGCFWVQDQVGDSRWPWIRHTIFEPKQTNCG